MIKWKRQHTIDKLIPVYRSQRKTLFLFSFFLLMFNSVSCAPTCNVTNQYPRVLGSQLGKTIFNDQDYDLSSDYLLAGGYTQASDIINNSSFTKLPILVYMNNLGVYVWSKTFAFANNEITSVQLIYSADVIYAIMGTLTNPFVIMRVTASTGAILKVFTLSNNDSRYVGPSAMASYNSNYLYLAMQKTNTTSQRYFQVAGFSFNDASTTAPIVPSFLYESTQSYSIDSTGIVYIRSFNPSALKLIATGLVQSSVSNMAIVNLITDIPTNNSANFQIKGYNYPSSSYFAPSQHAVYENSTNWIYFTVSRSLPVMNSLLFQYRMYTGAVESLAKSFTYSTNEGAIDCHGAIVYSVDPFQLLFSVFI